MSVLEGPREEWRRILHQGTPVWVKPEEGGILRLGDGRVVDEASATYLPPCDPTKIICIHLNYDSRRVEFKAPPLVTPTYFQKPLTTLNSHGGFLNRPADCQYLNYEGEIAAIVGKPMRNVALEEVWDHLAGFAPANDVGAQDFRDTDAGSMLRVKGQDGFCPIGPGVVRGVDIRKESVRTYINGKVVQDGPVSEMTFPIDYIFADLSRHITFLPGDIVLTGTPANSRPMNIGDVVEVEVTGVGRLSNTVQEAPAPMHKVGHQPTDSDAVRRVALGQF
ncbi:fumarylacetoacetate hydrolase family protein [Parvibaculum sp.]|uniref:fumarylacetoacetate hydrolase family protein n=1 Tax=Parvibaculum sp. TaxID=2024848 RepID=UPI003C767240